MTTGISWYKPRHCAAALTSSARCLGVSKRIYAAFGQLVLNDAWVASSICERRRSRGDAHAGHENEAQRSRWSGYEILCRQDEGAGRFRKQAKGDREDRPYLSESGFSDLGEDRRQSDQDLPRGMQMSTCERSLVLRVSHLSQSCGEAEKRIRRGDHRSLAVFRHRVSWRLATLEQNRGLVGELGRIRKGA